MTKKKQKVFQREVLINSLIAGGLVFFGAFTTGAELTWKIIIPAIAGAAIACLIRLKDSLTPKENTTNMFNFTG